MVEENNNLGEYSKTWGHFGFGISLVSLFLFLMPYFGFFLAIFALVCVGKQKKIGLSGYETATTIISALALLLNGIMGLIAIIFISITGNL